MPFIVILQAIIESDSMGLPLKRKSDALDLGRKFAKQIGCGEDDSVACMKEKVPRCSIIFMQYVRCSLIRDE